MSSVFTDQFFLQKKNQGGSHTYMRPLCEVDSLLTLGLPKGSLQSEFPRPRTVGITPGVLKYFSSRIQVLTQ